MKVGIEKIKEMDFNLNNVRVIPAERRIIALMTARVASIKK